MPSETENNGEYNKVNIGVNPGQNTRKTFGADDGSGSGSAINPYSGYGVWGSSGPSDAQKEAAANLAPLTLYGQETIENKANQMGDTYDIADQGNQNISNFQANVAERSAGAEWFSRLLKEQSTYEHQRDVMGNARYGSGALDLNSDFQRVHDANAVDVLEALESNLADIDTDALYALQANINARNELAANTEASLRSNAGDYAAQLNNISPSLANGSEEDSETVIDAENMALNLPDWIHETWFDEHKAGPIEASYVSNRTRPDQATARAIGTPATDVNGNKKDILFDQWDGMLQSLNTNNSRAANQRYWDTLTRDYGHRVV